MENADVSPSVPWWLSTPGEKRTYHHPIGPNAPADRSLPVMVVRGECDGPTLLVFAGIHGDEYEPMAAVQRVYAGLAPRRLNGTWVAVGCCNMDAYQAAVREGPADGKNLARVFPGSPQGTLTERVAYCLTEDFIRRVSFLCDLHSAGRIFRMVPLAGYMLVGDEMTVRQREAAKVFGLPLVWGTAANTGRSLSAAYQCGVPAIYCETTGTGGCLGKDVSAYVRGVKNLMIHLAMLKGRIGRCKAPRVIEDVTPDSGHLQAKNVTPHGGLFFAAVRLNQTVRRGDLLGTVVDLFGRLLFECRTDTDGTVILIRHLTKVEAGDALAVVV